jgi:ribonuclease HI
MDVRVFTDGACSGNPGPGGWGAILRTVSNGKTYEKELSGFDPDTTNNRMELTAVIIALEALKYPCNVTVTTDSRYVCDGISKGWARKWRANGWRKSDKSQALNTDLWESLLNLCDTHNVTFSWVKGHNEHPENTRCDELATNAIKNAKS